MPVSPRAIEAANASVTDEVWLVLLTIRHPSLSEPIRVVNNFKDIVSQGRTFVGCWFTIELPSDTPGERPSVFIEVDNVDRAQVDALRRADTPPKVDIEVVLASQPDVIEHGPMTMTLREATYDVLKIRGRLEFEELFSEPYPGDSITPLSHPSLF